eukprot:7357573-Lingulodinium_polyedra.AAC.1
MQYSRARCACSSFPTLVSSCSTLVLKRQTSHRLPAECEKTADRRLRSSAENSSNNLPTAS